MFIGELVRSEITTTNMTSHIFLLILVLMIVLPDDAKSAPGITFCGNLTESEKWFSGTELKIEPFPIEVKEGKELSIEGKISLHQAILSGFYFKAKLVANDNLDICEAVKKFINYSIVLSTINIF